jgi:hypothetical protein
MDIDPKYKMFYTQDELNAVYLGPEFRLNYRYTQLLVNFYICWMYAISMPILPLIGSLSFFCSYWIGKISAKEIYESNNKKVYVLSLDYLSAQISASFAIFTEYPQNIQTPWAQEVQCSLAIASFSTYS